MNQERRNCCSYHNNMTTESSHAPSAEKIQGRLFEDWNAGPVI